MNSDELSSQVFWMRRRTIELSRLTTTLLLNRSFTCRAFRLSLFHFLRIFSWLLMVAKNYIDVFIELTDDSILHDFGFQN